MEIPFVKSFAYSCPILLYRAALNEIKSMDAAHDMRENLVYPEKKL